MICIGLCFSFLAIPFDLGMTTYGFVPGLLKPLECAQIATAQRLAWAVYWAVLAIICV